MHVPVLLARCVELLGPALAKPDAIMVDATLGLGGHSETFLDAFPDLTLIGVDRDPVARAKSSHRLERFGKRFSARDCEHEHLAELLATIGGGKVDAILFDLGVSSMQLDEVDRGFSYSRDAPLDMRMNPADPVCAATLVNEASEGEIIRILRQNAQEKNARRIASAIVRRRSESLFVTTADLAQVVRDSIPAPAKRTGGNPSKRTFQALRIEVNRELVGLPNALDAAIGALPVGGRIAVMSYHSLEDRIVKRRFAQDTQINVPRGLPVIPDDSRPSLRLLTRGAEVPSDSEILDNPRAASAKLRAAQRVREAA